jgi:hypothetical protein
MGLAVTVFTPAIPDLLHSQLGIEGDVRGALEVPREFPGLLQIGIVALPTGIAKTRSLALSFVLGAAAL